MNPVLRTAGKFRLRRVPLSIRITTVNLTASPNAPGIQPHERAAQEVQDRSSCR